MRLQTGGTRPDPGLEGKLGGVHAGCYEVFATKPDKSIRDLKGKTVAVPELT
jgi:hypothetical protein